MRKLSTNRRRTVPALAALALLAASPALAQDPLFWQDGPPARYLEIGHGDFSVQMVPRYGIKVTEVGEPDADGNIFSFGFSVEMSSFNSTVVALNGMRSWRISVVSGELIGSTFQVKANDLEQMSVTSAFGPLTGLAVGDLMLVERIPVRQPIPPVQPTLYQDFHPTPFIQQVKL